MATALIDLNPPTKTAPRATREKTRKSLSQEVSKAVDFYL